jgi:serine/threonine protein kinase
MYGLAVDWWRVGVVAHKLLRGEYPFNGDNESDW